jgi:serine/threonine-protein kinase
VLLRRCLRKERRERLQDAAGVRIEIEDVLHGGSATADVIPGSMRPGPVPRRHALIAVLIALLAGAIVAGVTVWQLTSTPVAAPSAVVRTAVPTPVGEALYLQLRGMAVSPNGEYLAYVTERHGLQRLYLRPLDRLESTPLPGTEGAVAPFFSPDSQWVGFFAGGKLKKIPVTGGAPEELCDALAGYGGSWASNGVIYFSPGSFNGVSQVSAEGGTPQPFTTLQQGEITHRWPQVLPGGDAVLFTSRTGPGSDERHVQVQRVSSGERRVLVRGDTGTYVPTGHLLFVQVATGTLVAVPFDAAELKVGAMPPVALSAGILPGGEGAHYAVSDTGLLAYVTGRSDFENGALVWVDRSGNVESVLAASHPYDVPRLSPDGSRVAFMRHGPRFEVWVHDISRGDATKLISDGSDQYPIWTRDGKRLAYRATRAGTRNIFWRMADGSGTEERLTQGAGSDAPTSWSPDGQILLFTRAAAEVDILGLRIRDRTTQPFVQTRFLEAAPQFSPDGRWVAYRSDESGRSEIYVRPYPGPGGKWQVSTDGGAEPVWNPRGPELFYRNGNRMMSVNIGSSPTFTAARPTVLFTATYVPASTPYPNYDVSRDGRRFLMVQSDLRQPAAPTQLVVVLNWFEELRRLVPDS